jgi:squalene-hopene/tetraprenyl-beta-curcumene cyclase
VLNDRPCSKEIAMRLTHSPLLLSACILAVVSGNALSQSPAEKGQAVVDQALEFLITQQKPDGSFSATGREPPAVTALVVRALVQSPKYGKDAEPVRKGVNYLLSLQQTDGSLSPNMIPVYNTAIGVSALSKFDDPKIKEAVDKAVAYLKNAQYTLEDASNTDPQSGGWNYGGPRGGIVDLSNTAVVLEALKESGLPHDDPTYRKALEFVSRMQNHSETNAADWAGNDGGFIYNPGRNGEGMSSAGDFTDEQGKRRVRSYGAMSYAGLKSMIYAGLTKDDPRVKAAWSWVQNHWTVDENPGLSAARPDEARSGLYYYYYTLAAALNAYDEPTITAAHSNSTHDWRVELIDKLAASQKADGSFVGTRAYMESSPLIATPLATLALQNALADLKEHPAKP